MKPLEVSAELRSIAAAINRSNTPDPYLVIAAIRRVADEIPPTQRSPVSEPVITDLDTNWFQIEKLSDSVLNQAKKLSDSAAEKDIASVTKELGVVRSTFEELEDHLQYTTSKLELDDLLFGRA